MYNIELNSQPKKNNFNQLNIDCLVLICFKVQRGIQQIPHELNQIRKMYGHDQQA